MITLYVSLIVIIKTLYKALSANVVLGENTFSIVQLQRMHAQRPALICGLVLQLLPWPPAVVRIDD